MKGKSTFTNEEINAIIKLINQKIRAGRVEQKKIRNHIRKLGFYASDFHLGGGYTVDDFLRVINKARGVTTIKVKKKLVTAANGFNKNPRSKSDESYILDLCDKVMKKKSIRQHRFGFLLGDTGTRLPVDAWYPELNLVIEYRERQHTESVAFFDKKVTASGITRDKQRKLYDQRRRDILPKQGIKLVELEYSFFDHKSNKRLLRNQEADICVISKKLQKFISPVQRNL